MMDHLVKKADHFGHGLFGSNAATSGFRGPLLGREPLAHRIFLFGFWQSPGGARTFMARRDGGFDGGKPFSPTWAVFSHRMQGAASARAGWRRRSSRKESRRAEGKFNVGD